MKNKWFTRFCVLFLAVALCLAFTGCSNDTEVTEVKEDTKVYASAGGSINMPEGFEIPGTKNGFNTQLVPETHTLSGAFSLTNYRSSGYYYTSGDSLSVTVRADLDNVTKYTDATISLWVKGDNFTEHLTTVYFVADGTTQTYTFTGLTPNTQYKVNFTYTTKPQYLMTGTFNVVGFNSEATEETAVVAE